MRLFTKLFARRTSFDVITLDGPATFVEITNTWGGSIRVTMANGQTLEWHPEEVMPMRDAAEEIRNHIRWARGNRMRYERMNRAS